MGHPDAVVRADSLTKWYGRTLALDRLSLEVRPGEVLGFLGPDGAGKPATGL
jgi:ABC-type multidrug transport system ATPase subunit